MKHIEQIKSIVLTLLVVMSLILTFSIWSYTPNYQIIEQSKVDQITVGEQKQLHQVIQPYRVLARNNDRFTGTVSPNIINSLMNTISDIRATELRFIQSNLSDEKINSMIQTNKRITLFFPDEVPINTFQSILEFTQNELPEVSFDRLIIDWSLFSQTNVLQLLFVSEEKRTLYSTDVALSNEYFNSTFKGVFQRSVPYEEIQRNNKLSLYVPVEPVELVYYTYYIDEVLPDKFKDVLFKDPNIVKKNIDSITSSKYTDDMAFMTTDTKTKMINYVYPTSESIVEIKDSTLLEDSFEFINEHGGLTGDFRYMYQYAPKHITEYQLFIDGIPVFSNVTSTRITTTWGENQIFRYKRPYYILDMDINSEKATRLLQSGVEVANSLENINEADEIVLGYYLTQNDNELLYTLEPSWFVIHNGNWTRLTSDSLGGSEYGLE